MFERLGIKPNVVYIEQRIAMEKLQKGDRRRDRHRRQTYSQSPTSRMTAASTSPVEYSKPLQGDYLPATLTSKDYPNLIAEGETVDTIAVPPCWRPITGP